MENIKPNTVADTWYLQYHEGDEIKVFIDNFIRPGCICRDFINNVPFYQACNIMLINAIYENILIEEDMKELRTYYLQEDQDVPGNIFVDTYMHHGCKQLDEMDHDGGFNEARSMLYKNNNIT